VENGEMGVRPQEYFEIMIKCEAAALYKPFGFLVVLFFAP